MSTAPDGRSAGARVSLGRLAKAGFDALTESRDRLAELAELTEVPAETWLRALGAAADPDGALALLLRAGHTPGGVPGLESLRHSARTDELLARGCRLIGASPGLGEFFLRHPERLPELIASAPRSPRSIEEMRQRFRAAVAVDGEGIAAHCGEDGWNRVRVTYRELLTEVMLFDLEGDRAEERFDAVAFALSDLAEAAIDASLAVARGTVTTGQGMGRSYPRERVLGTRLAVIAMGKCGAEELNVVSDVDVIFVGESGDPELTDAQAIEVATRLATEVMRGLNEYAIEPPLWQVDPNLRPEGKNGPLVRSLDSHLAYYDRWAQTWEFQALLKARFIAGDAELGESYVERTRPLVWASSDRPDFVGSVQRMRERVTEHLPDEVVAGQLKLGPGGLRDVEFAVQLLQLVHGHGDESLRVRGTIAGIEALVAGGYIARTDAERLATAYREIRVLEHRLQLRHLRRTAQLPQDEAGLRWLARASSFAGTADGLTKRVDASRRTVRELHLKIFYAPLLDAVAALDESDGELRGDRASARLAALGFRDPRGALRHIAALSRGTSRRAAIQRNLLPVLLQWFAEGADPDYGLLSFRRISDSLRDTPWYLRLLRDGTGAAQRLTQVLSGSRFVGELLESIPESVAWLEGEHRLQPAGYRELSEELSAIARRHGSVDAAAPAMRHVHRRELLRLAMASLVGVIDLAELAAGLDAAHRSLLEQLVLAIRTELHGNDALLGSGDAVRLVDAPAAIPDGLEFLLVAMGRFGGGELGFSSDLDLIAVFRPAGASSEAAGTRALSILQQLRRHTADPRLPIDLDFDLRPEGRNGPLVRSFDATRAYYERWSLTWEAQALLRASPLAGAPALARDFLSVADRVRYPEQFGEAERREVRRIKARVEAERLPQGADPARHLKLGPGALSDVEWLIQLIQLEHAHREPTLRTTATLGALATAEAHGELHAEDAELLREAWLLASEIRSAIRLWSNRNSDVLPRDRNDLDGVSRILGNPPNRTSELEERYLGATRRARAVFERVFFGYADADPHEYPLPQGFPPFTPQKPGV